MAHSVAGAKLRRLPSLRTVLRVLWRFLCAVLVPRLTMRETALLCRELHAVYTGGIPLASGFEIIAGHSPGVRVRRLARHMAEGVRRGATLGDVVHFHRFRFPEFFVECVERGELSGKLEEAFRHLADYYEDWLQLRREILHNVMYPLAIIGALMIFFGPYVQEMKDYATGPGFSVEDFLLGVGRNILGIAVTLAVYWYSFMVLRQLGVVRVVWGFVGAHLWPFRPIVRGFAQAKFFRGLAMQLEGGLSPHRSIEGAARMCGNLYVGRSLAQAAPLVMRGMPVAEAVSRSRYVSPMVHGMLEVGEKSGKLDVTLRTVSRYCVQEGMYRIRRWIATLEAMLIVWIGLRWIPGFAGNMP